MPTKRLNTVTEEQWREAVEAFELGYKNGSQIARELGVSPSTVSREFKRRGCRKGHRAMETVAELEAALDAKARRAALRRQAGEAAAMARSAELDFLMAELVGAIVAADKAGNLASATAKIAEIGNALGVKPQR
jgi:IS30 family transposase